MKIEHKLISIKDIANNFSDNSENGITGLNGLLNIRPAYQREFVYKDNQREAVIKTILKQFPLNVMYWAKNDDGTFEVLDGQQRTISFCQFVNNVYSIKIDKNEMYFHTLSDFEKEKILNYKVDIYICEGSDQERLDWFRTINIAGEKLTEQELLNINYTGDWLTDAKKKFSKTQCIAYKLANKFVKGSPIRQEYLETVLDWISDNNITNYMSKHCQDKNANELWLYFSKVIEWVKITFNTDAYYRKEMLGLPWGYLYNKYHSNDYDSEELEKKIKELMENEEITDKKGVYEYILSNEDEALAKKLSKREFSKSDQRTVYEKQDGICPHCGKKYTFNEMEGDHIMPWWRGGKTILTNLQMLCKKCNKGKGGKINQSDKQ